MNYSNRDYILPGPKWKKQQQKKRNSLRNVQPYGLGEDELQNTLET